MAITDVDTALSGGIAPVRLRNQLPGETGDALSAVPEHQVRLTAARDATGPLQQRRPAAPALPPAGRPARCGTAFRPVLGAARAGHTPAGT
ncbi:hypothetical protein JIX56_40620 [Streptomyces sp. CA-210063]|uniref:hypothetical protein n=1 Tax=Streptomyces sp. CA-210063 TaxID=2801029 RepID=UPI00214B6727|nr:hypothetical protein [Streptomyces sp. CA-210063]UUU35654.1 hypothetical protein JIX56_40620 [Streptomyces sp. CA-210063]